MESHFYLLFRYRDVIKDYLEFTDTPVVIGELYYYRSIFLGENVLICFSQPDNLGLREILKQKETVVYL